MGGSEINKSIDILLAVMSTKLDKVIEELSEIKKEMNMKANIQEFSDMKKDIEDLKKSKWFVLGASSAVSFFINHFWK